MYLFKRFESGNMWLMPVVFFVYIGIVNAASSLKLVNLLYRHGDRSPIVIFPTDPNRNYKWPEEPGWLTKIGMQQQYALGGYLRRRYVDTGFLSQDYKNSEVKIYSSEKDRCLMSAYCNLAGLFPAGPDRHFNSTLNWQPIPVHSKPSSEDKTLRLHAPCPRYDQLYNESYHSADIQQKEKENTPFYDWLEIKTGVPDLNLESIWQIADTVFIEKSHNLPLASWVNNTVYDKLLFLNGFQWTYIFKTKQMQRLKGGPLLGEMIQNMQNKAKANGSSSLKMFMYSGHESTVAALLSALQVYNGISLPYAAMVIMELHQNTSGQHFVKLFYKNSTVDSDVVETLSMPDCGDECPLRRFVELTRPVVPVDWVKECMIVQSPTPSPSTSSGFELAAGGVRCFACSGLANLKYCDHVETCRQDEVCYVSRTTHTDGNSRMRSGCIHQQQCIFTNARRVGITLTHHSLNGSCLQCCSGDFCNKAGCGDQGFSDRVTRGPLCFDCSHVNATEDCNTVRLCAINQTCKVEEFFTPGNSKGVFKQSCEDSQTCARAGSFQMKRSDPLCSQCCGDDFCNRNCTVSLQPSIVG